MRRLVFCCDGTWNHIESAYPTNVLKLARAIPGVAANGTAQVVFYLEGVGTGRGTGWLAQKIDRLGGGMFGGILDTRWWERVRVGLGLTAERGWALDSLALATFMAVTFGVYGLAAALARVSSASSLSIAGLAQAFAFIHDRPKESMAILAKHLPAMDPKIFAQGFEVQRQATPKSPRVQEQSLAKAQDFMLATSMLNAGEKVSSFKELYTNKYVGN